MLTTTLLKKFLLDCQSRRLSRRTLERYRADISRLIDFLHQRNIRDAQNIHHEILRAYFAELHEKKSPRTAKPLSPHSTAGIYRSTNTFFQWCHRENHLRDNPMSRLRPPRTPKQIIKRLSERQILILLHELQQTAQPTRNRAIILLMLDSGLRRGETVNLTIHNIHTREKFVDVKGKGEKERRIPIGTITAQAIDAWLEERPQTKSKMLFIKSSGKPITGECIRAVLRRINNRMKLGRLYPHLLRHTFAKLYLKHGNLNTLAQILGHADIKTTAEIYVGDTDIDDLIEEHRRASPLAALNHLNPLTHDASTRLAELTTYPT